MKKHFLIDDVTLENLSFILKHRCALIQLTDKKTSSWQHILGQKEELIFLITKKNHHRTWHEYNQTKYGRDTLICRTLENTE